jgi:hypothetical protein
MIQATAFSIQEFVLAGLYIFEARRVLEPARGFQGVKIRQVMRNLIYVNVLVILLDIAVLCTQYAGLFEVHVVFKGAAYSVKLFVEFFVLNQLTDATSARRRADEYDESSEIASRGPPTTDRGAHVARSKSRSVPRRPAADDGQHLGYASYASKGRPTSAAVMARDGQVLRTTEVVVESEQGDPTRGGEKERRRSGGLTSRRREEWIELDSAER